MDASANSGSITRLLAQARLGDRHAENALFSAVYAELRGIAQRQMRGERSNHTLQPTALINEAWFRMIGSEQLDFASRSHFFAVAANIMRRILIDHARAHRSKKRGGEAQKLHLNDALAYSEANAEDLIDLDKALDRLKGLAPRQSRIVELHFFGGMTFEESAIVLGISSKTAKRDWRAARVWLHGEIYGWSDDTGHVAQN